MKRRLLESLGVVMVLATILVVLQLTAVPMSGQAEGTNAWGHPNLEGIWFDVYATPFERAAELGDRELATAEERAAEGPSPKGQPGARPARPAREPARCFWGL